MAATTLAAAYLESVLHRFDAIKHLGDAALVQLRHEDFAWSPDSESNSIAVTIRHLHGNMMSRWTDFLTTDGEKNRDRDAEFETTPITRDEVLRRWEEGWSTLFGALRALRDDDLTAHVVIRGQELTVIDAIHRQIAHYAYHVGQIVYIAKYRTGPAWKTLSIPRGQSRAYRPTTRD